MSSVLLPIAPLDGESGYLRWRESVLLRLHALGVADALTEEERPADEKAAAGKRWERADAMCRGHILATLSDRLLPAYAPHATAAAVWRAVARTYDLGLTAEVQGEKAKAFRYAEGEPVTEQLALLEGLATNAELDSYTFRRIVKNQFKKLVIPYGVGLDEIWEIARQEAVDDKLGRSEKDRRARHLLRW